MDCIKICPNPHCEAVFHNCPESVKKCNDCGTSMRRINEKTYNEKFALNWFQYDYRTMEYFRPLEKKKELLLDAKIIVAIWPK